MSKKLLILLIILGCTTAQLYPTETGLGTKTVETGEKALSMLYWPQRIVHTFVHELGHGIPRLLFGDGKLKLFVDTSFQVKNLFGYCSTGQHTSRLEEVISLAAGPLCGIALELFLLKFFLKKFKEQKSKAKKVLFAYLLSGASLAILYEIVGNLIPQNSTYNDGTVHENDGMRIKKILFG